MTARDYTIMIKHVNPYTSLQEIQSYFVRNYQIDRFIKEAEDAQGTVIKGAPTIARIFFASNIEEYMKWKNQKTELLLKQRREWISMKNVEELKANELQLRSLMLDI
jgi:hypothetical protein